MNSTDQLIRTHTRRINELRAENERLEADNKQMFAARIDAINERSQLREPAARIIELEDCDVYDGWKRDWLEAVKQLRAALGKGSE